ncbi:Tellurite methyltransferase [Marinibacterium anthonyi]|nr:Tellurite methyltransferase [Marinibacterium anthonyi]
MNDDTIRIYDAKAEDYARMVEGVRDTSEDKFMAEMTPGGTILDLGCGPGHAAKAMAAAGFVVTAVDGSAEMVRLASKIDGITARQARFDEIDEVDAYDGIWASFSLLHAPRADFPAHLAALKRAMRPGGLLFLGMKIGDGEKVDSLGRFYSYYSEEDLVTLLEEAGFAVTWTRIKMVKGLAGEPEPSISVFARG